MESELAMGEPSYPSAHDLVWRGFYDAQLARLHCLFGANHVQVTVSERVFESDAQRDREYNRILAFVGAPPARFQVESNVFTRPTTRIDVNLTQPAKALLRKLYFDDTRRLYARLGDVVHEWENWYAEQGLPRVREIAPPGTAATKCS